MKNRRKYIIFDKTNAKIVRIFQARHRSTIDEYEQKITNKHPKNMVLSAVVEFCCCFFFLFFGSPQFMILVAANVTIVKRGSRIIIVLRCNFTLNRWYSTSKLRFFYYLKSSMQSHLYNFFLRKKQRFYFLFCSFLLV